MKEIYILVDSILITTNDIIIALAIENKEDKSNKT